jgi:hypothetical protein
VARGSRARARRIGAGLACLLLIGGCYYVRYASLVRTHVDLMIALAAKRHDLHVAEAPPSHLAEFRYPLERARDFARIVGPRFGERESFRRFTGFLDAYEATLEADESAEIASGLADLHERRTAILAALDRE